MKKILILCTGNSCRSQMAEAWMRYYAGDKAEVYSAGTKPEKINPYVLKAMDEAVIDMRKHKPENVDKYRDMEFNYVITVCDNAKENCPVFPGNAKKVHKSFEDPAAFKGTEAEIFNKFREVRNQIEDFCFDFVHNNIKSLIPGQS